MVRCPQQRIWSQQTTGSLTNANPTALTFDLASFINTRPDARWWRLEQVLIFRDLTATAGNLILSTWMADGVNLQSDVVLGSGQTAFDMRVLFPSTWTGKLAMTAENRTGATATFLMSFGFEPIFGEG